jgi:HEAT repeat protein
MPFCHWSQQPTSKEIRYALTFSLLGVENYKAVKMMIKLAQDRSLRVKDWATFGLGTQIEYDDEEIKQVLYKNCFSKDHQIRHEAIKGLANRENK